VGDTAAACIEAVLIGCTEVDREGGTRGLTPFNFFSSARLCVSCAL
jgi:hypothetical protein